MKRTRLFQITLGYVAAAAMLAGSVAQAAANDSHNDKVVASFLKHVASLDSIADKQKSEIKKTVDKVWPRISGCGY